MSRRATQRVHAGAYSAWQLSAVCAGWQAAPIVVAVSLSLPCT